LKVLVTGASRGIGKSIAKAFISSGYEVFSNYLNNFPEFGIPVQGDISKPQDVVGMLEKIGGVDVLVNNAGISISGLFQDISIDDERRIFDVNVFGTFNCTRTFLPHMISQKFGRIVNISSIWGQVGASCEVHYSASKSAIIGFTKALSKEVAPSGITVNAICPGVIKTDMLSEYSQSDLENLASETPVGRLGTPEDVAKSAVFLAENDFITGEILTVSGGFY
jgi:3-oxoacyl-[acyl-carrier protein] reductase